MIARKLISVTGTLALAASLSSCGTMDRQHVGIGAGAALGGVAGNVITDGSTLGTVGGAAIGGVIGNEVTKPKR